MFEYMLWLRETDSTQLRVREWSLPCGSVVVADRQKEGKGRKGRRWESQEGGLYFSFVLCEEDFSNYLQLPLVCGLALSKFLDSSGFHSSIKWPNDVYIRGRKIAGILVEKMKEIIAVGVGLNVNQKELPPDLRDKATSMKIESGRTYNRREVILNLLDFLNRELRRYREEGFRKIREEIDEKLLFKDEEVVLISEKPEAGILLGIDKEGFLLLQTAEGVKNIPAGEVSLRPRL